MKHNYGKILIHIRFKTTVSCLLSSLCIRSLQFIICKRYLKLNSGPFSWKDHNPTDLYRYIFKLTTLSLHSWEGRYNFISDHFPILQWSIPTKTNFLWPSTCTDVARLKIWQGNCGKHMCLLFLSWTFWNGDTQLSWKIC